MLISSDVLDVHQIDERPIIQDIMRRDFIASALSLTILWILPDAVLGQDEDVFPVSVGHKYGSTTIDSAPKRVVSFGATDEDMVLALGLVPVGLTDWWDNYAAGKPWPWAEPLLADAEYAVIPLDGETHYSVCPMPPSISRPRSRRCWKPDSSRVAVASFASRVDADAHRSSRMAPF